MSRCRSVLSHPRRIIQKMRRHATENFWISHTSAIIRAKYTCVFREMTCHGRNVWPCKFDTITTLVFYVSLTVHVITIFVNNSTHNYFSYICLFQFSICFGKPSAHHQESQLYQYDLQYMSLYVGDRVVCSSIFTCIPHGHLRTVTYIISRTDTTDSPDDEHLVARNM